MSDIDKLGQMINDKLGQMTKGHSNTYAVDFSSNIEIPVLSFTLCWQHHCIFLNWPYANFSGAVSTVSLAYFTLVLVLWM